MHNVVPDLDPTGTEWPAARGDFLYGFIPDEPGEQQIVRYRVIEPF